jgi:hypothetical protein
MEDTQGDACNDTNEDGQQIDTLSDDEVFLHLNDNYNGNANQALLHLKPRYFTFSIGITDTNSRPLIANRCLLVIHGWMDGR